MNDSRQIGFSIEGEFITNLAREKFHQSNNFKGAIELLMSCLQTDQITEDQRLLLTLKVLNGEAEITGTYPGDDYGVNYLEDKDQKFDIISKLDSMCKRINALESENKENLQKLTFLLEYLDLPKYELIEMNSAYYRDYEKELFDDMPVTASIIKKPDKDSSLITSFLTRMKTEQDDDYGWLAPDGTYYPVKWGEHDNWAHNYCMEHYPFDKYEHMYSKIDSDGNRRQYFDRDFLIYVRHWILLHSPGQGIAKPTHDPARSMTKAQKEFLYDYYTKRGLNDEANAVYQDST